MLESEQKRSIGAFSQKQKLNFNSLMHNSSQFDRGNLSTTIDGSQNQMQNEFDVSISMTDPLEQKHNSMNLALGKPTQRFRNSQLNQIKKNYNRDRPLQSLQGTTADSFAMQSSLRGDQQRPVAQSTALKEDSMMSSVTN